VVDAEDDGSRASDELRALQRDVWDRLKAELMRSAPVHPPEMRPEPAPSPMNLLKEN
jgi:hypothetical protein